MEEVVTVLTTFASEIHWLTNFADDEVRCGVLQRKCDYTNCNRLQCRSSYGDHHFESVLQGDCSFYAPVLLRVQGARSTTSRDAPPGHPKASSKRGAAVYIAVCWPGPWRLYFKLHQRLFLAIFVLACMYKSTALLLCQANAIKDVFLLIGLKL